MAIDYFIKWTEAKPFKNIRAEDIVNFMYSHMLYRFDGVAMRNFCKKFNIRQILSSRSRPQKNGQPKSTNKSLVTCLKKRLDVKKGSWSDLLEEVL